jgi:DNA-binding transcriptional LysR family regulator
MAEKYPSIEVYLVRGGSSELYRKVLNGDLDGAIIVQPPFTISKACDWRVLREEPLIVLTSAKTSVRDPHATLASEPFIRVDRKLWTGRLADGYLRKYGIRPHERYELDGTDAIATHDRCWPDSAVSSIRREGKLSEDKLPSSAIAHDGQR